MFLQYFSSCFYLVFLGSYHSTLSSEKIVVTSLCFDSITWEASVLPKRAASLANTLFWSYFRYSNCFLLFFSFTSLYFLAFSLILASITFLIFWIALSMWWASTTSSNWAWNYCSSLCLLYIFHYYSSSILALFWKISEEMGKDMIIQKKDKNISFLFMYCWPRHYHRFFR